jgi:hypothetical protein
MQIGCVEVFGMIVRENLGFGEDLLDKLCFLGFKIIPRLGIICLAVWIYKYWDKPFQGLFLMMLFAFMFFYFFPPFITVITILKTTDDGGRDLILYKLYKAAQGGSGVYEIDGCFLIKSYYYNAIVCAKTIMNKYNLKEPDYSFLLKTYRKKDFRETYYFYLEESSRKLIIDKYGFNAAVGLDVRHLNFWDVPFLEAQEGK